MTTQTKALKLALEALEDIRDDCSGCEFEWNNDYPLQAKAHAAVKEALAQPEQEPVAAAKKDEVLAASIEFIGALTGMTPPPIEVAPPEVFKPFRDFTEKVCSILATPPNRKPLTDEDKERCVGCEACIDTACGRDECPNGWPKAAQRTWVNATTWRGLTDEERWDCLEASRRNADCRDALVKAVEAKLKEKNT